MIGNAFAAGVEQRTLRLPLGQRQVGSLGDMLRSFSASAP
jgi:hypothetical protein